MTASWNVILQEMLHGTLNTVFNLLKVLIPLMIIIELLITYNVLEKIARRLEFLGKPMKDSYSFDRDQKGLDKSYDEMYNAYEKIFDRCGLTYRAVEADTGAIGGSNSHACCQWQIIHLRLFRRGNQTNRLAICGKPAAG